MADTREIREGAGLEEARLNQDFIEFLRKWSTPILVVIAVVAVSYAGYTRWKQREHDKLNEAYAEFQRVSGVNNPSPESLKRVAEDYEGIESVSILARLAAADVYLQSVRRGVKPGSQVDQAGAVANKDDLNTPEDRKVFLENAEKLYTQVADQARSNPAQRLIAIGATYGLAAVAECREDLDAARKQYEAVVGIAKDTPFAQHAAVAQQRIASLDSIKSPPKLYALSELPAAAVAPPAPWQPQPGATPPTPTPSPEPAPPAAQGPPAEAPAPAPAPTEPQTPPAQPQPEPAPTTPPEAPK